MRWGDVSGMRDLHKYKGGSHLLGRNASCLQHSVDAMREVDGLIDTCMLQLVLQAGAEVQDRAEFNNGGKGQTKGDQGVSIGNQDYGGSSQDYGGSFQDYGGSFKLRYRAWQNSTMGARDKPRGSR
ncbi:hypothetical protein KSS87_000217, partial [Heliosperma pusillum]